MNTITILLRKLVKHIETYLRILLSFIITIFSKVHKGRVLFWSTTGKDYSCNPLYISNYILNNKSDCFDVYWMFRKSVCLDNVDNRINKVVFGSLKYHYIIQTSEFIITNHRTFPRDYYWIKRKKQKYIMTWHGSMPLKMIEKDAEQSLPNGYVKVAKKDSSICDLMISDSKWYTNLIKTSFWYNGEILESGMPRNDIFYKINIHPIIKNKVLDFFRVENGENKIVILYAPTFRTNHGIDKYILKWSKIQRALEEHFKKEVVILLRLHPTLLQIVNTQDLITETCVKNASSYSSMQELLIACDLLITDYSSTMFESALLRKPCFLYAPDLKEYDRGMYFPLGSLPFAISQSCDELEQSLIDTDQAIYIKKSEDFLENVFHVFGEGNASHNVVSWMLAKSIYSN